MFIFGFKWCGQFRFLCKCNNTFFFYEKGEKLIEKVPLVFPFKFHFTDPMASFELSLEPKKTFKKFFWTHEF